MARSNLVGWSALVFAANELQWTFADAMQSCFRMRGLVPALIEHRLGDRASMESWCCLLASSSFIICTQSALVINGQAWLPVALWCDMQIHG